MLLSSKKANGTFGSTEEQITDPLTVTLLNIHNYFIVESKSMNGRIFFGFLEEETSKKPTYQPNLTTFS